MMDKESYTRAHKCTRPRPRLRSSNRTHARTQARGSTEKYVLLIVFHCNNDSQTLLSVMLYVHCLSCLIIVYVQVNINLLFTVPWKFGMNIT
jgi:hypothetical protein